MCDEEVASGGGGGAAETPAAAALPDAELDDRDLEPRTPMKRLGSTRKLAAFNNIRAQLSEQARVLEARAEATAGVLGELHEYCRRRAELEHEYSRALDKLARGGQRGAGRRELWPLCGAHGGLAAAQGGARALARDHAALAELYGGTLAARLQRAADDALRLHRKCRELLLERHEELAAALAAAAAAGKAHAAAAAAWRAQALKLRAALDARNDPPKHKKIKALDKELEKRRARHGAARAEALRARADCVLSLEAANATLQRYYLDDIADIVLCMEVGLEAVVARALGCAGAAEAARGAAAGAAGAALRAAGEGARAAGAAGRRRLLEAHAAAFAAPRALAPPPDEAAAVAALVGEAGAPEGEAEAAARAQLAARLARLEAAARALRAECREAAKTLDAAEAELVRQAEGEDAHWDVAGVFGQPGGRAPPAPAPPAEDQEDYYLAKFRAYVSCAARLARAEGKAGALRAEAGGAPHAPEPAPRRARAGAAFAAPLDGCLPRVLAECARVIGTHGVRQRGVFRVSAAAAEVGALRAAFERGEEPLAHGGARDVHAACALLKLYLRSLRPPLLPARLQARLLRVAALTDDAAFAAALRAALAPLPPPALLVLRYVFALLAHVASHADRTLMDAWNLAVCVGPSLLAAWGDAPDRLAAQNRLNELVKRTILLHERVFPQDVAPHALYRPPAALPDDADDDDPPDPPGPPSPDEADGAPSPPAADSDTEDDTGEDSDPGEWPTPSPARSPPPPPPRAPQV